MSDTYDVMWKKISDPSHDVHSQVIIAGYKGSADADGTPMTCRAFEDSDQDLEDDGVRCVKRKRSRVHSLDDDES